MRILRNVVFASIPTLLLLGVLALGFVGEPENDPWLNASPLWGPGDPFYAGDPEKAVHLSHPVLIWRPRPGFAGEYTNLHSGATNRFDYNAFGFRDDEVAVPKPDGTLRVLNIGDSSTWGLNLYGREETYSDQLAALLPDGGRWDVVNAGVVGYSSLQGVQLLRHWLGELEPDVVTIYLGNNDPSPSAVQDADRVAATAGPLHGMLQRNRFYLLLQKALLHMRASRMAEERAALSRDSQAPKAEGEPAQKGGFRLAARVSPEQYEENLRNMVRVAREAGARPILLEVPMNLVWPPKVKPRAGNMLAPGRFWGSTKTDPGYLLRVRAGEPACARPVAGHPYLCIIAPSDLDAAGLAEAGELARRAQDPSLSERERLRAAHNGAVRELIEGDPAAAARRLAQVAANAKQCRCLGPQLELSWLYYNLGIARLMAGEEGTAFVALLRARSIRPFAMSPEYAERFGRVVEELEVDWIDLPRLFAAEDPGLRGSALMSDWVHPNRRGNAVIARALERSLRDEAR